MAFFLNLDTASARKLTLQVQYEALRGMRSVRSRNLQLWQQQQRVLLILRRAEALLGSFAPDERPKGDACV